MCDALLAAAPETADGITLFAKNSDRKPSEPQPFLQLPAASHPPGARVRCTHIEIPQVAETQRVMGHAPFWVWGFEHGVNEHRVAIGNLTVFAREPVEEKPGLIGMDLVRLGLERARTARAAIDVIAQLLEAYGQGGAAFAPDAGGYDNAFVLADPHETWILETMGREWAAKRESLAAQSNHIALGSDWDLGSKNLERVARDRGYWKRDARLHVAEAFRNPQVPGRISEGRLACSRAFLTEKSGRVEPRTLCTALRDHRADGPAWPGGRSPDEEAFFTVCAHSAPLHETTASLIAPLPPADARPWPVWISFATPCTGVFLPVYLDAVIPAALARAGAESASDSAWWVFKALQDAAATDFPRHTPALRNAWSAFEAQTEEQRAAVESSSAAACTAGEPDRASALLSEFTADCVERALDTAAALRTQIVSAA
jgi:dipeptidase